MTEEYDPDAFALRISPSLFQLLQGRAEEPGPIEARTPREASLIEAVRREGKRERSAMLREVKEAQLKHAQDLEDLQRVALQEKTKALEEKLRSLGIPLGSDGSKVQPCTSFKDAVITCYRVNGKDNPLACAGEVEAFTECAKQLSRLSH